MAMSSDLSSGILVTGVGGGVGQSILKCLSGRGHRILGADSLEVAAGLYVAPKAYLTPPVTAPQYASWILDLCLKENVSIVFPGLDTELTAFAREAERFRQNGVIPVISSPSVVSLCDDKLETAQFLTKHGFPAPRTESVETNLPSSWPLPVVLKPKVGGARSKGVFLVKTRQELDFRLASIDRTNYVVQEHIEGEEYTCGLVQFDGRCVGPIVMRRQLRDGDTYRAFVAREPAIEQLLLAVAAKLQPYGPCNFQLRLRAGVPYIFEINDRCSGTTYARALAGFNEPLLCVEYLKTGRLVAPPIRDLVILRYWKELAVEPRQIESLKATGSIENAGTEL
jgi:carbamoyl-phosphate synthase large subunit